MVALSQGAVVGIFAGLGVAGLVAGFVAGRRTAPEKTALLLSKETPLATTKSEADLTAREIRAFQNELSQLGFYRGAIDGHRDTQAFRDAVARFQRMTARNPWGYIGSGEYGSEFAGGGSWEIVESHNDLPGALGPRTQAELTEFIALHTFITREGGVHRLYPEAQLPPAVIAQYARWIRYINGEDPPAEAAQTAQPWMRSWIQNVPLDSGGELNPWVQLVIQLLVRGQRYREDPSA